MGLVIISVRRPRAVTVGMVRRREPKFKRHHNMRWGRRRSAQGQANGRGRPRQGHVKVTARWSRLFFFTLTLGPARRSGRIETGVGGIDSPSPGAPVHEIWYGSAQRFRFYRDRITFLDRVRRAISTVRARSGRESAGLWLFARCFRLRNFVRFRRALSDLSQ